MKNINNFKSLDLPGLNVELLSILKKYTALRFSKNNESKVYRKNIARIKTEINRIKRETNSK